MKKMIVLFLAAGLVSVAFVPQATDVLVAGKGIDGYVTVGASTSTQIKTKFGEKFTEIKHYSTATGTKTHFSTERAYPKQGISFYFPPNSDTIFCIKVKQPYKAKTDKGIALNTSTMQQVRDAYGPAEFYSDEKNMFLEYPGIKFYTPSAQAEADALKQKVTMISITEFEK
jgi:hypothetical protein